MDNEILAKLDNKVYEIGGIKFKFKDLTLDEQEHVEQIQSRVTVKDGTATGDFTGAEVREFLNIILEPVNPAEYQKDIFGKINTSLIPVIMGDFFLRTVKLNVVSRNYLEQQFKKLKKSQSGLKD